MDEQNKGTVTEPNTEPVEPDTEQVEQEQEPQGQQEQEQQEPDFLAMLQEQLKDDKSEVHKAFMAAVKAEVEKRIAGQTPKANPTSRTKAELDRFRSMTYKERLELAKANPDTYKKLSQLERSK